MAEPLEPIRPKSKTPPPLQRLWKMPPEPEEVNEPAPSRNKKKKHAQEEPAVPMKGDKGTRKKKKQKAVAEADDDGTGAIKLEETPVLDTYQARQRARWIIGGILGTVSLITLMLIYRNFTRSPIEEVRENDVAENRAGTESKASVENEARILLNNAKQAEKIGQTKAALVLLHKLTKTYQNTAAAREATQAIERNRLNRSLFGNDQAEQANASKLANAGSPMPTGPIAPKNGPTSEIPSVPAKSPDRPATPTVAEVPVLPIKILPTGFRARSDAAVHPSGWPTRIVCDRDDAELVLVPGGTFSMGREDGDPAERPAHPVAVSTYYIDKHEVTVRQYLLFLKDSGRPINVAKLTSKDVKDPLVVDDLPVVNVSAREAREYCLWARRHLPTEAQWEFAARSPEGRISFWNGELPRKDPPKGPRTVEPVMSLPSDVTVNGVFDMAANAWEWTSEFYDSQYYQQFRKVVVDPTGPKEPRAKIPFGTVKGGSKAGILTWREGQKLETRLPYLGFRGALLVEGLPVAPLENTAPTVAPKPPNGAIPF